MFNKPNLGNVETMQTMFPHCRLTTGREAATLRGDRYFAPLPPPPHSKAFVGLASSILSHDLDPSYRSLRRSLDYCRETGTTAATCDVYKQLWLQACRLPIAVSCESLCYAASRADGVDFRVWRNFSTDLGLELASSTHGTTERSRRAAAIADCYPFRVPQPSHMGDSSLSGYLEASTSGKQRRSCNRQLADMRRFETQVTAQLDALAWVRRPSLDSQGRIKPPPGYKRYPTRPPPLLPKPLLDLDADDSAGVITADMQPDLFGKLVKKRRPRLWKLSYRTDLQSS